MAAVFWSAARDAPGAVQGKTGSMLASLSAFRGKGSGRAWALTLFYFMAFGGFVAMFLYLPKLLVDVHDLVEDRRRRPRRRLRAARGRRRGRSAAGSPTGSAPGAC